MTRGKIYTLIDKTNQTTTTFKLLDYDADRTYVEVLDTIPPEYREQTWTKEREIKKHYWIIEGELPKKEENADDDCENGPENL